MSLDIKPLFLFADSELLFWKKEERLYLNILLDFLPTSTLTAAYIGASNGDEPAYYEIFQAAMSNLGITDTQFIRSDFNLTDRDFLAAADIILLAGGDVEQGLSVINKSGMSELIIECYQRGALIIGVSAGAVQLGAIDQGLNLIPFYFSCHEEAIEWQETKKQILSISRRSPEMTINGFGIPKGGGAIYHPNEELEPIKKSVIQFQVIGDTIQENVIVTNDVLSKFYNNGP